MRLLGNARTGPLFTDSYHCSQLLTKYAKEPHILDRELWYAHQVKSVERIPKLADNMLEISNKPKTGRNISLQESYRSYSSPASDPPGDTVR